METRKNYQDRVYRFMKEELSEEREFHTSSGLTRKVSAEGKFLTFVGDTVVFLLDHETKSRLITCQNMLYEKCQELLAERIDPDTFHMTLHDLSNGTPSEELWITSQQNYIQSRRILAEYQQSMDRMIRLKSVSVFPMMNTSIVLGLEPADESTWQLLMEMYEKFQEVVRLDYPLTLHITLAYLKPGEYDKQAVCHLKEALHKINNGGLPEITLSVSGLVYQRFDDMNYYYCVTEG